MPQTLDPASSLAAGDLDAQARYRQRIQEENCRTQQIVIGMARGLNRRGGYVLANDLETWSLFSRVPLSGARVLEVGCGTLPATMSVPLHEMPALFIASDVNRSIVAEARHVDARPRYLVCSALDPSIRKHSLDLVVLNGVLHHLPPECNLLGALAPLLREGGAIVLLEPNVSCCPGELAKWALRRFFGMSMEASPYGQFSQSKIEGLVRRAGLRVADKWYCSLLAFPLTGGGGRVRVLPDARPLFLALVTIDAILSRLLGCFPFLARILSWRVLYLLRPGASPSGEPTSARFRS
ncbi:MAG: methyltransferase domain-containing protein [Verrucomicrobiae bacterium]|nr:methyltransferase domain-containing protein [Verrucomicrobiae bacterium]